MNFLKGEFAAAFGCATLGIRSEHIEIVEPGQGTWTGKVVHSEDLGSDHFLFVDIGSEEPVIVRQSGKNFGELGREISIRPVDGHAHRFGPDDKPIC